VADYTIFGDGVEPHGRTHRRDDGRAWRNSVDLQTDATGALALSLLHDVFAVPQLTLNCALVTNGSLLVRPNAVTQIKLSQTTSAQLAAAMDYTTTPPTPVIPPAQTSQVPTSRMPCKQR